MATVLGIYSNILENKNKKYSSLHHHLKIEKQIFDLSHRKMWIVSLFFCFVLFCFVFFSIRSLVYSQYKQSRYRFEKITRCTKSDKEHCSLLPSAKLLCPRETPAPQRNKNPKPRLFGCPEKRQSSPGAVRAAAALKHSQHTLSQHKEHSTGFGIPP